MGENILIDNDQVIVRPNSKVKAFLTITEVSLRGSSGQITFRGTWGPWSAAIRKVDAETLVLTYDSLPGRINVMTGQPLLVRYTLTRVADTPTRPAASPGGRQSRAPRPFNAPKPPRSSTGK